MYKLCLACRSNMTYPECNNTTRKIMYVFFTGHSDTLMLVKTPVEFQRQLKKLLLGRRQPNYKIRWLECVIVCCCTIMQLPSKDCLLICTMLFTMPCLNNCVSIPLCNNYYLFLPNKLLVTPVYCTVPLL